ncbi:MAG: S8 family serine peptidase, partial [Deltaproteobacteria bacterium]|nr:S8 family serine peptidase [Deltaproteobacteria bacterium]
FIAPTDSTGENPDPTKAPDVINNSWTCPPSEGCTDPDALRLVVENTRAAGILVIASAGNDGPGCSTVSSAISIYDAVLTVGATDIEDDIAQFSSRGSVSVDGSGRVKPDIAAPGVEIRSSVPGEAYDRFNGTSMAGPHVAGMAALALSAAECTRGRPHKLERHLLDSALPRAASELCGESSHASDPNNSYGHGILRAVLPACRLDGRILGRSESVAASRVTCRNRTAGRKTTLRPGGLSTWNCMASGLAALAGDTIQLKLTGAAVDGEAVRGRLEGLEADKLRCLNRTSGASVRAAVDQRRRWSCSAAGLEAAPGDRLKIIITGRALADS